MHYADPGPLTKGARSRCSSVLDKGAVGAMQRSLLVLAVQLAHAGVVQAMLPPPNTMSTTPPPTNPSTTPHMRSKTTPPPSTLEKGALAPSALVRRGRATVACSGSCSCPSAAAALSGSITDGSGSYSDGEDCSWVISRVGSSISISFSQFATETCCDKVVIYSCSSSNSATSCVSSSELASLSGSSISSSRSWTSTTGYMRVRFTSDSSGRYSDGEATVACSGSCSCPSDYDRLGEQSGSITDGSGSYSNGEDCSWVISTGSVGSSISISFSQFATETCCDQVVIYSCSSSNSATSCVSSSELASLSGSSISSSRSWTSTTGYMRVRFTSDSSNTYAGFVGNWAASSSQVGTAAGFVGNWVASSSEDDDETVAPAVAPASARTQTPPRTTQRPIVDYPRLEWHSKAWFQIPALKSPYVLYVLAWTGFVLVAGLVAMYFAARYGGAERGDKW
jgi:hypothetical protein